MVRMLSVIPRNRGVGFAILEDGCLLDWGVRQALRGDAEALSRVHELVARYQPDTVVLEDVGAGKSQRRAGVRALLQRMHDVALGHGLAVRVVAWRDVYGRFIPDAPSPRKDMMARAVGTMFPELALRVPPPRKSWQSEDPRIALFAAVGFGVVGMGVRATSS